MARILILGGGFAGVVAAEALTRELSEEHHVTLVSRSSRFVFFPALVRLAFGECEPDDVSFDLRKSMLNHRVTFVEAEIARVDPDERKVLATHGDFEGLIPYDYLIFALGRRLATERVPGFFEHAHHLLDLDGALKFGKAVCNLRSGHCVIGQCPEARLPVPVYETAFAMSQWLEENGGTDSVRITVVSPTTIETEFADGKIASLLREQLVCRRIEFLPNFPIATIGRNVLATSSGQTLNYDLAMLLPPFLGASAGSGVGIADDDGYISVDWTMKALGAARVYAAGDCTNFSGPKMGHMAVNQARIAAANLAAEITGREAVAHYNHEMMMVLDVFDGDSIYFHKKLWSDDPGSLRQGRFWTWAKQTGAFPVLALEYKRFGANVMYFPKHGDENA